MDSNSETSQPPNDHWCQLSAFNPGLDLINRQKDETLFIGLGYMTIMSLNLGFLNVCIELSGHVSSSSPVQEQDHCRIIATILQESNCPSRMGYFSVVLTTLRAFRFAQPNPICKLRLHGEVRDKICNLRLTGCIIVGNGNRL